VDLTESAPPLKRQAHGKLRPMHIGHWSPSTWKASANAHRPLVTKHTGNFGQCTSAIGYQAHGKLRPRHIGHRSAHGKLWPRHIGHRSAHGKLWPRHIGHRSAHGKLRPRHIGHRSPHTRETSANVHRPSVTKHTGNFLKGPMHIGYGQHTGNFGRDTSAIGHQARGAPHEGSTPLTPRPSRSG